MTSFSFSGASHFRFVLFLVYLHEIKCPADSGNVRHSSRDLKVSCKLHIYKSCVVLLNSFTTQILRILLLGFLYQLYFSLVFFLLYDYSSFSCIVFPHCGLNKINFKFYLKFIFFSLVPHRLLVSLDSGLGRLKICHRQVQVTLILASLLLKEVSRLINA